MTPLRLTEFALRRSFYSKGITFDPLPILSSFVLVDLDATPLVGNGARKAVGHRVTGNVLHKGVGYRVTGSGRAEDERGLRSRGVVSNPLILSLLLRAFVFLALGGPLLDGDFGRFGLWGAKSRRDANATLTVVFAGAGVHEGTLLDSHVRGRTGTLATFGRSKVRFRTWLAGKQLGLD